jgi:hypothetical protein
MLGRWGTDQRLGVADPEPPTTGQAAAGDCDRERVRATRRRGRVVVADGDQGSLIRHVLAFQE